MNVHQFLFKVFIITITTLKLTLVFSPIVMALRAMRIAPFNLQDEVLASLLIGFGVAMCLSAWNAMEFDNFRFIDLRYYLKPKQKAEIQLNSNVSSADILTHIENSLATDKNWKADKTQKNGSLSFEVKSSYRAKDIVTIDTESDTQLLITSKPSGIIWVVDFGRNYLNVIKLLNIVKTFPVSQ
jgi:hypothetical protein